MPNVSPTKGGMQFDLRTIPPLKEFQFQINRFAAGLSDWSTMFGALGVWFKARMGEQFGTEGAASGGKWADLSEAYATWKEEHYPGRPIGVLTGALRSSMIGGPGYSQTIAKTFASYGMSEASPAVAYGKHFAARRPVIRMTPNWGRDTQKLVHTWLVAEERGSMGVGGAGLSGVVAAQESGVPSWA